MRALSSSLYRPLAVDDTNFYLAGRADTFSKIPRAGGAPAIVAPFLNPLFALDANAFYSATLDGRGIVRTLRLCRVERRHPGRALQVAEQSARRSGNMPATASGG